MSYASLTTELLHEFNTQQIRDTSVSSADSTNHYAPKSPTPSIQEVTPPPSPRAKNATEGLRQYPPVSPTTAENVLRKEGDNIPEATRIVTHGLITTIRRGAARSDQRLTEARRRIDQLQGVVHSREREIRRLKTIVSRLRRNTTKTRLVDGGASP